MRIQIVDINGVGEGVIPLCVVPCQKLAWLGLKLRLDPHSYDDPRSKDFYIVDRNEAFYSLQQVDQELARRWKRELEMDDPFDWLIYFKKEACRLMRTLKIRVTGDPCKEDGPDCRIPLWVREAWIGCTLEPNLDELQPRKAELFHVGSEKQGPSTVVIFPFLPPDEKGVPLRIVIPGEVTMEKAESKVCYSIDSHEALLALSNHNKAAFGWWIENQFHYWAGSSRNLMFSVDCCEVIECDEEDEQAAA